MGRTRPGSKPVPINPQTSLITPPAQNRRRPSRASQAVPAKPCQPPVTSQQMGPLAQAERRHGEFLRLDKQRHKVGQMATHLGNPGLSLLFAVRLLVIDRMSASTLNVHVRRWADCKK